MEQESAFELARKLDAKGFDLYLRSRSGDWVVSVSVAGLEGSELSDLAAVLAEAEMRGQVDDRGYLEII